MSKYLLVSFTVILLSSCQFEENEKEITVRNIYSIEIPSFLSATSNLNSDASLQYQHLFKELFVVIIDETKEEFRNAMIENKLIDLYSTNLDGYTDLLLDNFSNSIDIKQKSEIKDTTINTLPAKMILINGLSEGVEVFYIFGFIEGSNRFYQVVTWTNSNKKVAYQESMKKMIFSFREL